MAESKISSNKNSNRNIVIGVIVGLVVGIIIGLSGANNGTNSTNKTSSDMPSDSSNVQINDPNKTTTKEDEKPKTWQTVTTLSGDNKKIGDIFQLTGGKARMIYTVDGSSYSALYVYIVDEGDSLEKGGGSSIITAADVSGETNIVKSAGSYYLDVSSSNTSWTVTIEEYK